MIQNDDFIRIPDGGKAVRHDKAGAATAADIGEQGLLGEGVEGAGGFVQHQQRGIPCQSAGNLQSLPLPAAEIAPSFVNLGLVASLDQQDVLMDAGVLRRLDYIALGNGFIEKGDILPYRPRDLKYILIHGGKGIDDDGAGDFPPLHPVKEHFSRPFLIQSRDDFRQGGFAAAGGTHHGYPVPRLQVHIKMLQKGRLQRAVTEAHILHHQIPRQA